MRSIFASLKLFSVVSAIVVLTGSLAVWLAYEEHLDNERRQLIGLTRTHAHLIESVAQFDRQYSQDYPGGASKATFSQVIEAFQYTDPEAPDIEFVLARRRGETIEFILHYSRDNPAGPMVVREPIALDSPLAEPMRRALAGGSGSIVDLDYRGERVLAAFTPIALLDLGFVAKMDIQVIAQPYRILGVIVISIGLAVAALATVFYSKLVLHAERALRRSHAELESKVEEGTADLRANQQQLEAIIDNSPAVFFAKAHDGRYLMVNTRFEEGVGLPRTDVIGRTDRDIFPTEIADPLLEVDRKVLTERVTVNIEETVPHPDGTMHRYLVTKLPLFDERAQTLSLIGMAVDITRIKQFEKELSDSENKYRNLVENMSDGMVILDTEVHLTYANPALCRIVGCSEEEIIGRKVTELLTDEGREELVRRFAKRNTGTEDRYELWWRRKDGTTATTILAPKPLYDSDGRFSGSFAVITDISDRKETEQKLLLLGNVTERSSEAILITDAEEVIRYVNPSFTRITGYTPEDVVGQTPRVWASGRHDASFYRSMWQDLTTDGVWHGEVWNRRKDGRIIPEFITINAIYDPDGKVSSYVAIFSDISRLRQREEELRKINAELEEFAYVTSHDLREPLRMISSYMGLIELRYGSVFDERAMEYFRFVRDGAQRMDDLIQDVLAYSRIGRHENDFAPIDLGRLLDRVTAGLSEIIEDCGAALDVAHDLPTPLGEATEIERVFTNLIANALKYRDPERPPRIGISGRIDRDKAVFSVADNGIGIDAKFRDRIFRMFQRLHGRDDYGGGTGIGLAICQKIVTYHGGRIWVEAQPGEGSTFTFTLPLARQGAGSRSSEGRRRTRLRGPA